MTLTPATTAPSSRAPRGPGPGRPLHGLAAVLALGLSVAACSKVDRTVATSSIPADYHQRHPVALVNARQSLDIFLVGADGRFDYRQKHDIQAFSADFIAHGEGRIQVLVPRGPVNGASAETTLAAVRRALAAAGVSGDIEVGSYQVRDAKLASVLRLSFIKLQARAASRCGDWPDDLNSGSSTEGWENRTYSNLGCASQQTLAAQLDDPRDLIRPRAEDPSDVLMRTRAIKDIRGNPSSPTPFGFDPSTTWDSTALNRIGSVGGQ